MSSALTYSSLTLQNPADVIRADTRDTRRLMNPLAGITALHRNAPGYRYSSPHGDGVLSVFKGSRFVLLTTHCSLLTKKVYFCTVFFVENEK